MTKIFEFILNIILDIFNADTFQSARTNDPTLNSIRKMKKWAALIYFISICGVFFAIWFDGKAKGNPFLEFLPPIGSYFLILSGLGIFIASGIYIYHWVKYDRYRY